jgi:hypothetical protein
MAEQDPGKMDITEQERTFDGFVRWTVRTVLVIVVILIVLAAVGA